MYWLSTGVKIVQNTSYCKHPTPPTPLTTVHFQPIISTGLYWPTVPDYPYIYFAAAASKPFCSMSGWDFTFLCDFFLGIAPRRKVNGNDNNRFVINL